MLCNYNINVNNDTLYLLLKIYKLYSLVIYNSILNIFWYFKINFSKKTNDKVSKEVVEGIDFWVYESLVDKRKSYIFISNRDIYYATDVVYENEDFNSNLLVPVIHSIQNEKDY